jgi:hypothetical protein
MDATWSYDQKSGRYRDERGRFLSKASIEKLVDARIDKLDGLLRRFTRMLINEQITLDQWQSSVRESLKAAHIQAAIIGYGGKANMGSAEYGRIGQRLREEYTYLQNFAGQLLSAIHFRSHGPCSHWSLCSKCSRVLLAGCRTPPAAAGVQSHETHFGQSSAALCRLLAVCGSRYCLDWHTAASRKPL